jgi:PIN domain nuclease of toxin-antitoxin system
MDILLDTHTIIWFSEGEKIKLSVIARQEIENPLNQKFVSIASFWEIAIKTSIGKLKLNRDLAELENFMDNFKFQLLPVSVEHTKAVQKLEFIHRDPFDRMLVAQADHDDLSLVTADKNIKKYKIKTIW